MLAEILLFGISLGIWLVYKLWYNVYNYWERKGFPHIKGKFPFGSDPSNVFSNHYLGEYFQQLYNKLDPHPIGGFYSMRKCELVVRDPEFIKRVLVKDFSYFRDRSDFTIRGILGKHLFAAEGDLWRSLRVKLTPTFTTGKLTMMFSLFQECANKLDEQFKSMADKGEEIDAKDLMARFTTDIICSCAFGLEVNSLENPDNELRRLGESIFLPYIRTRIIVIRFLLLLMPSIKKIISFRIGQQKMETTLYNIIKQTVEYRDEKNITRNDFLDLLINLRNKDNLTVNDNDGVMEDGSYKKLKMDLNLMVAQCFVFFAAGFETSSSVQTYCMYELAMNPTIQDKLIAEIDQVLNRHNGELSYHVLQEMPYLEQVLYETMRKYPTLPMLTRICVKDYPIQDMGMVIDKGTRLTIPVFALHHDPKYFPEPEKFLPERFDPENKSSINPCTYLPFGDGPRNCIGKRFGMLQTKIGIVTTLAKYRLVKSEKTPERLTFSVTTLTTGVNEKITMRLVHRKK